MTLAVNNRFVFNRKCLSVVFCQVNSILHSKLELTKCVPKLKRIRQLLENNLYRGHFDDRNDEDEENPIRKV